MGEGVFSSGNWGLVVPGSSSGFLTALVILMESCTVEGSLLQLVLLLWPKIDRVAGSAEDTNDHGFHSISIPVESF